MNLATNYLGLSLKNPLVVGASPFCENTSVARQLQDAGAGAIVMRSLFEEQIDAECIDFHRLSFKVYRDFGFEDITVKLALRPEKRIGSDARLCRSLPRRK